MVKKNNTIAQSLVSTQTQFTNLLYQVKMNQENVHFYLIYNFSIYWVITTVAQAQRYIRFFFSLDYLTLTHTLQIHFTGIYPPLPRTPLFYDQDL